MTLTSLKTIKGLLKKYQAVASKRLGQHFLVNREVLKKIVEAANLRPEDIILEIGPGIGTLTQELAKRVKKVIAVEKDRKMCDILLGLLEDWKFKNVEIIQGDIRNLKLEIRNYKVVANLPYYITSPVIRKFLETEVQPLSMVLMVQKEVAQRICARPPDMSLLAVSVQFYSKPEIISYVSKKNFWPQPKVDSAIIRIVPLIKADKKLINADLFFQIVHTGFSQPRKQLINNFSTGFKLNKITIQNWLLKNSIQPSQRAETLNVKDWLNLTQSFSIFQKLN